MRGLHDAEREQSGLHVRDGSVLRAQASRKSPSSWLNGSSPEALSVSAADSGALYAPPCWT